jgi:hypothetical protein
MRLGTGAPHVLEFAWKNRCAIAGATSVTVTVALTNSTLSKMCASLHGSELLGTPLVRKSSAIDEVPHSGAPSTNSSGTSFPCMQRLSAVMFFGSAK